MMVEVQWRSKDNAWHLQKFSPWDSQGINIQTNFSSRNEMTGSAGAHCSAIRLRRFPAEFNIFRSCQIQKKLVTYTKLHFKSKPQTKTHTSLSFEALEAVLGALCWLCWLKILLLDKMGGAALAGVVLGYALAARQIIHFWFEKNGENFISEFVAAPTCWPLALASCWQVASCNPETILKSPTSRRIVSASASPWATPTRVRLLA